MGVEMLRGGFRNGSPDSIVNTQDVTGFFLGIHYCAMELELDTAEIFRPFHSLSLLMNQYV